MTSKASVRPIVLSHFNTLRDDRTGDMRVLDLALFVGVPAAAGIVLRVVDFRMQDIGAALAGIAVFTALLFGLVIFVFQLRVQVKADGRDRDRPSLASLIDETFVNVTYSVVVGLGTTTVGIIAAAIAENGIAPVWISATLATLALHLLLTILMCLKRVHAAYQQLRV